MPNDGYLPLVQRARRFSAVSPVAPARRWRSIAHCGFQTHLVRGRTKRVFHPAQNVVSMLQYRNTL